MPRKQNDNHGDRDKQRNKVVNEDNVKVQDFKLYAGSDDDKTRIVDGEKVIESFHRYDSEDDDNKDEKDQERS